jgi:hypothetical protein
MFYKDHLKPLTIDKFHKIQQEHDFTIEWVIEKIKENSGDEDELLMMFSIINQKINLINDVVIEFLFSLLDTKYNFLSIVSFKNLSQYMIFYDFNLLYTSLIDIITQPNIQRRPKFILECLKLINISYDRQTEEQRIQLSSIIKNIYDIYFNLFWEEKLFHQGEDNKENIQNYLEKHYQLHPFDILTIEELFKIGYFTPFLYVYSESCIFLCKTNNEWFDIIGGFLDNNIKLINAFNHQWKILLICLDTLNLICKTDKENIINTIFQFVLESPTEKELLNILLNNDYIEQRKSIIEHIYIITTLAFNYGNDKIFNFYYPQYNNLFIILDNLYTDESEVKYINKILKIISQIKDDEGMFLNILRRESIMKRINDKNFFEIILLMIINDKITEENCLQRILWLFDGQNYTHNEVLHFININRDYFNYFIEIILENMAYKPNLGYKFYYKLLVISQKIMPDLFIELTDNIMETLMDYLQNVEDQEDPDYNILMNYLLPDE